jgi:hypothetical protein
MHTITITVTVYKFDELSGQAKARAIEAIRETLVRGPPPTTKPLPRLDNRSETRQPAADRPPH